MELDKMTSKQLQNWISKLSYMVNDGNNAVIYQKWLKAAQAEQLKRITVVLCVRKK